MARIACLPAWRDYFRSVQILAAFLYHSMKILLFSGAHNPRAPGNGLATFKKFRLKCALKNVTISSNYPLKKRENPRNVWSLIFLGAHFKRNLVNLLHVLCHTNFSSLNPDFLELTDVLRLLQLFCDKAGSTGTKGVFLIFWRTGITKIDKWTREHKGGRHVCIFI